MGDVKTNTSRFCGDALLSSTGAERGAWAVFSSKIRSALDDEDELAPVYAIAHRRGVENNTIHKFVATCGLTLQGKPLTVTAANDEEVFEVGELDGFEISRKCPRVLNDVTAAQPAIDCHNRWPAPLARLAPRCHAAALPRWPHPPTSPTHTHPHARTLAR